MPTLEELRRRLDEAAKIADTLDRRLWVLAIVSEALTERGVIPVIAGDAAVEFSLSGAFRTNEVEIRVPYSPWFCDVLADLGFAHDGRFWFREDADPIIEAVVVESPVDLERATQIVVDDLTVYLTGLEDMIADGLKASVDQGSERDERQAARLLLLHWGDLDFGYLNGRASEDRTGDAWGRIYEQTWRWSS